MGVKRGPVVSLGAVMQFFPLGEIQRILVATGRQSQRIRKLPAELMVYWTVACGLFVSAGGREVLRRVLKRKSAGWVDELEDLATESALSQARTRLGSAAVRKIYETIVRPLATRATIGAWFRRWRVMTIDATILDVADTPANARVFRRPGVSFGSAAYPQVRLVSLLENGTHILFGAKIASCRTHEAKLARQVIEHLPKDSLCLADRAFFGYPLWQQALATGADLLWRIKADANLPKLKKLPDGSYLTRIYRSVKDRQKDVDGIPARLIEFAVDTRQGTEHYRLLCSIMDYRKAPAIQLAHLYNRRWTIETVFAELKTTLRGSGMVLRAQTPDHIRQEIYGMLMAHFGVRAFMLDAALAENVDPTDLSFVHAVRVVHRYLPLYVSFPPSIRLIDLPERPPRSAAATRATSSQPSLASRT
ncbi:MAG TPA: IS4 family transposase [Thermoanaerobaculia bacterium]|nr:IS4 family transposase [Thermoanaerobaculia bacterium]